MADDDLAGEAGRAGAMTTRIGRCLCGEVAYEFDGPMLWRAHCHCESCRRNTASPFTTFFGVAKDSYRFTGRSPSVYHSSPGVSRHFCANCGTPVAYESARWPDEIHFYAASLDDPAHFEPERHVHYEEKLPWIHLADDLPKIEGAYDPEDAGTG